MAAVALFMVGRLAKFNDIFTSTVPTINNFSNHALRINCLTLFVQLKIQNNILFLYTTQFPNKNIRILDIGCSTAGQLAGFKKLGYKNLLGVDPSPACTKAAERLYGIEVRTSTISTIDFESASFDLILLVGVLEHVSSLAPVLKKIKGLLARGGKLYLEVPDALRFDAFDDAPYQEFSMEHIIFFSPQSLNNLLIKHGFKNLWNKQNDRRYSASTIMSNISALFENADFEQGTIIPDDASRTALNGYIKSSRRVEERIVEIIKKFVNSREEILVWGVGTHTQRLLEITNFSDLNISAFIDSNSRYHGKKMNGVPIIPPSDLKNIASSVLISSRVFQPEIEAEILRITSGQRKIIKLYKL